jgi:hypothetical protein
MAYDHLPGASPGQCRDVRMMERIYYVTSGPARSSPPMCHHPGHCRAIPNTMGTELMGRCHADRCTAPDPLSARHLSWCTDDDQARTPTRPVSKLPLDKHRSRHDARRGRDSSGQPSNRPHCAPCCHATPKALRHNCKPPPLGLQKEEAAP